MSATDVAHFDSRAFDISRSSSCTPETRLAFIDQDPLDTDPSHLLKTEPSRTSLMDAQRYDSSKRTSHTSGTKSHTSPKLEGGAYTMTLDPEAVIERLLFEAERLKLLGAQRYDPRSRTSSPDPDRNTIGFDPINSNDSDTASSSYGSASSSPSRSLSSPATSEPAESITTDSDGRASIRFSPVEHEEATPSFAATWKNGVTVTTRTIIRPTPRKAAVTSKSTTPFFTPPTSRPTSRPSSPKSPRAILRSLNCVSDARDTEADKEIARAPKDEKQKTAQEPASEPLTIFVTQQVDGPLAAEEREREQLWREAMCSLHFGGNWEQMNKRFPPGKPRW